MARLSPRDLFLASAATLAISSGGCGKDRPPAVNTDIFGLANGCFSIEAFLPGQDKGHLLAATPEDNLYDFRENDVAQAGRFLLRATDLGTYLLRDVDGQYVFGTQDGRFTRVEELESDETLQENGFISPAEWEVLAIDGETSKFRLRQLATGLFMGTQGLEPDINKAAEIVFYAAEGCSEFPELTLDAQGSVTKTRFEDGTLFGFVDAHEHLFSNIAFGGGGTFHGAPFHRLGVEHALQSCEDVHGAVGQRDVIGHFFSEGEIDLDAVISAMVTGAIEGFDHNPEGFPEFTDWPNSFKMPTHQMQYYRWLERAYLGGLRLLIQHSTSNQVMCELTSGAGSQVPRFSCNEMEAAELIFAATRALERYIDAQHGGPGKGWFRVVETPAEARAVIGEGKLAVVLGIETSNPLDCFLTPPAGFPECNEELVVERLNKFQKLGMRAMFPVHKFDNAFSAGDGHRGFIELGNFVSGGHFSNYTKDCPNVTAVFDQGGLTFGNLNQPRDVYDAPPAVDTSGFADSPLNTLLPFRDDLQGPPLEENVCQNAGLQPLGEFLMKEMMLRGMIIEVDHLPQRSYQKAYELLNQIDYPAAGTHGSDNRGNLYSLGGISTLGLGRCIDPNNPQGPINNLRNRIQSIADQGGFPAQGFGFDFNGFALGPRPRFGPDSDCSTPQDEATKITYPFTSFGGDVTFEAPQLGARSVDFNNEGMIHIGLLPELIQDARNVGYSDADLEPIFRSAEGYLRMWEKAEARAAELRENGF